MNAGEGDLEIVGLRGSNNGRSCERHEVCGADVDVGDVLRLVPCILPNQHGDLDNAIKLHKVVSGCIGCCVGFVPRVQCRLPHVQRNINQFCMVVELYKKSPNTHKNEMDDRKMGMASVVLLNEIPD